MESKNYIVETAVDMAVDMMPEIKEINYTRATFFATQFAKKSDDPVTIAFGILARMS